jgi:hypothetical protein
MIELVRALFAEGGDPTTKFVIRHEGSPHDALRSTVGVAAKLTVADGSTGKPAFARWVDLRETYGSTARSGPPMRQNDSAGTPEPGTAARPGDSGMTNSTILVWHRVYGDRGMSFAECALGTFRGRLHGRRCLLLLNDVKIGDHRDAGRARKQADRLIEATAQHLMGRSRRQAAVPTAPQQEAAPSPEPTS